MNSEYKISTILRTDTQVKVLSWFYETNFSEIEVTIENYEQYPDHQLGEIVQEVSRTKFSPEFEFVFSPLITDGQIQDYLYVRAAEYGTPIN